MVVAVVRSVSVRDLELTKPGLDATACPWDWQWFKMPANPVELAVEWLATQQLVTQVRIMTCKQTNIYVLSLFGGQKEKLTARLMLTHESNLSLSEPLKTNLA